jgi:hypothetical protein
MNDTLICKRCGWHCTAPEPGYVVGDEGRLHKLPDEMTAPHPTQGCNSPFIVDQPRYWDLDLVDPNLPPLRVFFKEIAEFESAVFVLKENDWVKERDARASAVWVLADPRAIYPEHEEIYGKEILAERMLVRIESLTSVDLWPILEVA